MEQKVTPGEIVVMAAGGLALIASFLPFYTGGGQSDSAWSTGLFPVATLVMLFALAAGALVALDKFTNLSLAQGVLGIRLIQLVLALGFFAAILVLAFLVSERFGASLGVGYFLLLIAGIGSVVGGVLMRNERQAAGSI